MVERSLSMREVRGSMPRASKIFFIVKFTYLLPILLKACSCLSLPKTHYKDLFQKSNFKTPKNCNFPKRMVTLKGQFCINMLYSHVLLRSLIFSCPFFPLFCTFMQYSFLSCSPIFTLTFGNGHTMLNIPVLVRSPKSSNIGPGQYLDG